MDLAAIVIRCHMKGGRPVEQTTSDRSSTNVDSGQRARLRATMARFTHPTALHETLSTNWHDDNESKKIDRSILRMSRRNLLRGAGLATGAGVAAAVMKPSKAHGWGGGWGGWGGGWGGGQSRIDVVLGLMGAVETLDPEEIAQWLANDVVYENTGLSDVVGKTAVADFFGPLALVFETFTVDIVNITSHGNLVCAERLECLRVSDDAPMGNPGAELVMKVAGWYEVQCGKVVRWSDYWDTLSFAETLGIPLPTA